MRFKAAVFEPLLSILTFSGMPLDPIAFLKNFKTDVRFRFSESMKSTVFHALSTAL